MSKLSLSFKDRILSIFQLKKQEYILGSDPECDLHVDSLAVDPQHARIKYEDGHYTITDMSDTTGIIINGKKIGATATLVDGDHLQIGKHSLVFTFDERNEPEHVLAFGDSEQSVKPVIEEDNKTAWLQFLTGSNMGKTRRLKKGMTNLNFGAVNESKILISHNSGDYFISQLQGDAEIMVNGKSIGDSRSILTNNSEIRIGKTRLLFYLT